MPKLPPVKRFVSNNGVRIYRIPCQVLSYLTARVYLLLGVGLPTLIDTGSGRGESTRDILKGLDAVRTEFGEPFRPADLKRIVISHTHIDHIGGLGELVKRTGAEVAVHPLESRCLAAPKEHAVVASRRLHRFFENSGVEQKHRAELVEVYRRDLPSPGSLPAARLIEDGQEFDGLRFVHAPGHSPGMLCAVVGDVLLCADHILARTIPQQWPESLDAYAGLGHYLASLEKVRKMGGFDLALAGHEPVMHNVYKRIDAIRESNLRRLDRLVDILRNQGQPMTIGELAVRMYTRREGIRAMLAVCDVAARVEYLYQRGGLAIANLEEIEADEHAAYRYCPA